MNKEHLARLRLYEAALGYARLAFEVTSLDAMVMAGAELEDAARAFARDTKTRDE